MVVLFATAYVHNNNIAFLAMFFVFSLSFVSVIIGRINIKKTDFSLLNRHVFAGGERELEFKKTKGYGEIQKSFVFENRGVCRFDALIKSSYPLMIAQFYKKKGFEILVYPELKGVSLREVFAGAIKDFDFEGLKRYSNEDIKYIHWPSLAKGALQVKVFSSQSDSKAVFVYEKLKGTKEEKISQIALWAYEAFREGVEFEIVFPEFKIKSKEGFDEVFKKLALY